MASTQTQSSSIPAFTAERGVLFGDVMPRRGNQYQQYLAKRAPNVLDYAGPRRRIAARPKA